MHLYLYILLNYFLFSNIFCKQVEILCPGHCKCDMFETLRRATCVDKNLATIESNLPRQTQLLDLSINQITHLNDNIFLDEKLVSLKLLNISHNKVSQIGMQAFEGMSHLKTLDLSYNAVQYILGSWFDDLTQLEELYLRGNSFSKFDQGPIFPSKTLKRLDLSLCRISYIGKDALVEIPNLEILDISDNYLIQLKVDTIEPLPNLTVLNVNNNSFSCNGVLKKLSEYCIQKGIRFRNPCKPKILESEKFQRMVNMAEPEDEKNSWVYDDEHTTTSDNTTKPTAKCNSTQVDDKSLLQEIVDLSPSLSIIIPFIYGIAVGVLLAYTIHVFGEKKKDLGRSTYFSFDEGEEHLQRRRSGSFRRINNRLNRTRSTEERQERQNLPLREWKLSESTPVLYRKNQANFST